jgi:hypothetical protein
MPALDKPPQAPDVAASQPGPNIGPGMQQAQAQQGSPSETAINTAIKILSSVTDETAKPYVEKALASLKIGQGMMKQKQPMAAGMSGGPMQAGGGQPPVPTPPMPGQMPV